MQFEGCEGEHANAGVSGKTIGCNHLQALTARKMGYNIWWCGLGWDWMCYKIVGEKIGL